METIYLIDASAFVFRAYYALAPLSSKGRPSHAVTGFASMLLKLLRERQPKHCFVVFDSKKPSFRKEFFTEYKANREAPPPDLSGQMTAVRALCEAAGLPILQGEGFEADDWIASFVEKHKKRKIIIVSSDKDLTQLIDKNVHMYDSFREKEMGPSEVFEKWQVTPAQMHDLLAMTGDSSDNIPGLPGVGPKTASKLLADYGSISGIEKNLSKTPEKFQAKWKENRDLLDISHRLVALKKDLPIDIDEFPEAKPPFPRPFKEFLEDWECTRVIRAFPEYFEEAPSETKEVFVVEASNKNKNLHLVNSTEELAALTMKVQSAKRVAIDIETNSFDRTIAKTVGVSVAVDDTEAFYVPWRHHGNLKEKDVHKFVKDLAENPDVAKIGHNLKYEIEILSREDIHFKGQIHDTMILAHLLNADRRSFSLENLAHDLLGLQKGDLKGILGKSQDFSTIDLPVAVQYAANDAHLTFKLFDKLYSETNELYSYLYNEVEIPLISVLASMEETGVRLNSPRLKKLSKEMHEKLKEIEKEIYKVAGEEFNIQSPKQLQTILFEKLKLPPVKKTKTGYSTDESVLQELSTQHELPALIIEQRVLAKLTSTYVDVLPTLVAEDGRLHTSYHQTGTATGRLSSSEPNLQNIPIRSEEGMKIREAFVPEEGWSFVGADYSQVELRLFAHFSNDQKMIDAFRAGRDIHSETARIIFGSDDKEFRARAKAINFGIIYGISAFGLAKQLGISRSEAQQFMESYFKQFPGIKEYMVANIEVARKNGYSETLFGRRRPLPDIQSKNPGLRQFAERIAVNAPLQGTAADIMKWAMVKVNGLIAAKGLKARILLQVHDELILEAPQNEIEMAQKLLQEGMSNLTGSPAESLRVPLVVDVSQGKNWAKI